MRLLFLALIASLGFAAEIPSEFRLAEGTTKEVAELKFWWHRFGDPELDSLIARGIKGNIDLRVATSRLEQARASRRITHADQLPQVHQTDLVSRQRLGVYAGRVLGVESGFLQSGYDASWELDFFGARKKATKAADFDIESASDNRRDTLLVLLAEITRNYLELRGLDNRIEIAARNVVLQKDALHLVTVRAQAGLGPELDIERQDELLANTEAAIPALEIARTQTAQRLAFLIGESPNALDQELKTAASLPGAPMDIPAGLPSDLLKRRPDVRRAEAEIAAQAARVGVAKADLFPKFSLTGAAGRQSTGFSGLTLGGGNFFSIGPSVSLPIFTGGRIKANIALQDARWEEARIRYEGAVLNALQDVESALVAYDREHDRTRRLERAVASGKESVSLATELYSRGLSDFLTVLDAQRELLASEDALEQSRILQATDAVRLYKALGGGWQDII